MAHEKSGSELSNCPLPLFLIAPHSGGHPPIVWISHCPVVLRVGQGGLDLIEKKAASRLHADSPGKVALAGGGCWPIRPERGRTKCLALQVDASGTRQVMTRIGARRNRERAKDDLFLRAFGNLTSHYAR